MSDRRQVHAHHRGQATLFNITLDVIELEGIDNTKLIEEVLANQQVINIDPNLHRYEDTVFNPSEGSEGNVLLDMIDRVANQLGLQMGHYWSHVHQPLESTSLHNHVSLMNNKNVLSWVYYVNVPEKAGNLVFVLDHLYTSVRPKENTLYVFPSWIQHKVTRNFSNDIRISIAGNFIEMENNND